MNSTNEPTKEGSTTEYDCDDTTNQLINLYVVFLGLFGTIDNTFVVIVIVWFTKMKTRITGLLILNQTLVDLTFCISLVCAYSVFYNSGLRRKKTWANEWAEVYCRLFSSEWFQWGMMLSSTINLVVFNLERYLSVVHPTFHKGLTKENFAYPALVFVWLSGPIFCLLWAVSSSYVEEGVCMMYAFNGNIAWSTVYGVSWVVCNYLIPLASMVYFYSHMIVALGGLKFKKARDSIEGKDGKQKMSRVQKSLLKTMTLITLAFVGCMSWDNINRLLYTMGKGGDYESDMYYYAYILSSFNSCINPFIYIINYQEFQDGVRKMLRCGRVSPIGAESHMTVTSI